MRKAKRFCSKGHDKSLVGKDQDGSCRKCKHERFIQTYVPRIRKKKQFCVRKHDTFICGRDERGMCFICKEIVQKEYLEKHREEARRNTKQWAIENVEHIRNYREMHKKELLIKANELRRKHPERVRATNIKQATNRNLRIVAWTDWDNIRKIDMECPNGLEVDHYIPLLGTKVSGLHVSWNLQYITSSKNRSKGNRIDLLEASEWYGKILEGANLK